MKKYKYRVIKAFGLERKNTEVRIFNTNKDKRGYDRSFYKKGVSYFDYDIAELVQHPITQQLLDTNRIILI